MNVTEISVGNKVTLCRMENKQPDTENQEQYITKVLQVEEEDKIHVAVPTKSGQVVALRMQEQYRLCIYTNRGIVQCNGIVVENRQDEEGFSFVVRITAKPEFIQRRQYFRLETLMDITYREYLQEELEYEKRLRNKEFESIEEQIESYNHINSLPKRWRQAILTDISGGGARFNSRFSYLVGSRLRLKLTLDQKDGDLFYEVDAIVVSSKLLPLSSYRYENRVEFYQIDSRQRENIIKFVFKEEREIRRREKGLI